MRLPIIDNKMAISFHSTMNEFEPFFEDYINENSKSEAAVFTAVSVALRIAAKLCKKFNVNKINFIDAAKVNFDMENCN